MEPIYFEDAEAFRRWLAKNHAREHEVLVGFHRKGTRLPSMTWAESVDEALCYGWIDGVRHRVDERRFTSRFSPRKPTSNWSERNIGRVAELERRGRMRAAGRRAFEARTESKSGVYSYEQRHQAKLEPAMQRRFRANSAAWTWFQATAPSYRTMATWWVMSAKKPETRVRRLDRLIADSAEGRRVPPLEPRGRR